MRTNWTPEYAGDLRKRIDDAIDNYLEVDRTKKLREATACLASIQNPAIKDLSALRIQVVVDFVIRRLFSFQRVARNMTNEHTAEERSPLNPRYLPRHIPESLVVGVFLILITILYEHSVNNIQGIAYHLSTYQTL
jgi:hypothetical protein